MVLLQSFHANITVKYFQLSVRSDACAGWVQALTRFDAQKTKQKKGKQHTVQHNTPNYFYYPQINFKQLPQWSLQTMNKRSFAFYSNSQFQSLDSFLVAEARTALKFI